jgi:uncharacterized cupin superfamily protein
VIVHIKGNDVQLEPVPNDDGHEGDAVSAFGSLYESADGAVHVGMWDYEGELTTIPQEGYEEILILLEGSLDVECDGGSYSLSPGDVLIYDCPIGGKRLRSPGAKIAYVIRYREPATA